MAFLMCLANQVTRLVSGGSRCAGGVLIIETLSDLASFELALECLAMLHSENAMQTIGSSR
jgi:hypothetical protein